MNPVPENPLPQSPHPGQRPCGLCAARGRRTGSGLEVCAAAGRSWALLRRVEPPRYPLSPGPLSLSVAGSQGAGPKGFSPALCCNSPVGVIPRAWHGFVTLPDSGWMELWRGNVLLCWQNRKCRRWHLWYLPVKKRKKLAQNSPLRELPAREYFCFTCSAARSCGSE